jgi:hypothetical protein
MREPPTAKRLERFKATQSKQPRNVLEDPWDTKGAIVTLGYLESFRIP